MSLLILTEKGNYEPPGTLSTQKHNVDSRDTTDGKTSGKFEILRAKSLKAQELNEMEIPIFSLTTYVFLIS